MFGANFLANGKLSKNPNEDTRSRRKLEIAQSLDMATLRNRPRPDMNEPKKDNFTYQAHIAEKVRAIAIKKGRKNLGQRRQDFVRDRGEGEEPETTTEKDQHYFTLISEFFKTDLI